VKEARPKNQGASYLVSIYTANSGKVRESRAVSYLGNRYSREGKGILRSLRKLLRT
jgi:hypothetical protein